uniref:Uncharacterized protein n=1 Tax=Arundo donax TaxID=35708 RepID=A0A0A8ZTZ4_ARUDO
MISESARRWPELRGGKAGMRLMSHSV